jgi:hypothetical protein
MFMGGWLDAAMGMHRGLFYGPPGDVSLVQMSGVPAPGVPGENTTIRAWHPRLLTSNAQLGLSAIIGSSDSSPNRAVYVGPSDALELAIYSGAPAPGAPGGTVGAFFAVLANTAGQIAYQGYVTDPDSANGVGYDVLTAGAPGNLALIAREGTLLGYPAIAVSQLVRRNQAVDWEWTTTWTRRAIAEVLLRPRGENSFWSINLPALRAGEAPRHVQNVRLSIDPVPPTYEVTVSDPGHLESYRYVGVYHERTVAPGTGVEAVFNGDIAVTPIHIDATCPTHEDGHYPLARP